MDLLYWFIINSGLKQSLYRGNDDDINRCGLTTILRNTGYEIKEATTARIEFNKLFSC
ncbi:MAG TPA: hypothetical protein VIK86_02660 [Candidatus Paceibacterota bacterium]